MDEDPWEKQKVETEKHTLLRRSEGVDEASRWHFAEAVLAETVRCWRVVTWHGQ
jgi:hypothetical protein